jgi:hypothetical protein
LEGAVQLLRSVVGQIEVKPGCRCCWVGRNVGEDSWMDYREEWDSEKAFARHIRSLEFHPWLIKKGQQKAAGAV